MLKQLRTDLLHFVKIRNDVQIFPNLKVVHFHAGLLRGGYGQIELCSRQCSKMFCLNFGPLSYVKWILCYFVLKILVIFGL